VGQHAKSNTFWKTRNISFSRSLVRQQIMYVIMPIFLAYSISNLPLIESLMRRLRSFSYIESDCRVMQQSRKSERALAAIKIYHFTKFAYNILRSSFIFFLSLFFSSSNQSFFFFFFFLFKNKKP
jgi:DNA integrity scanning protein DisA with diadenylate cyclase activity